jgi:hypothetical protein
MKNVWWVVAIAILMACTAFAQVNDPVGVHIQEGVVITPGQVKKTQSGGNNPHRFHIEISASPEDKTSMWITGPCLDSTFWFQGSLDINSPPAGSYGFNYAGFYWTGEIPYPSGVHDNVSISIYFDDSLLVATSSSTICFSYPYNNPQYPESLLRYFSYPVLCGFSTPYISAFKLSILDPAKIFGNPFCKGAPFDPTGCSGWNAGLDISGVNNCSGTLWLPESDIITLSIVQGSQFVSFHRGEPHTPQEVNLGSVATVIGGAGGVYLVPDGMDADSLGDWIVVRAESGTISSQDRVFLEPSYWHFYNPGTEDVEHMGEARINLEPVNVYDHYIEIPDSTHLDISLDSAGMKYGSLQIGDSVGNVFRNVPWGSLPQWDEYVTYVADGAIAQQPVDAHVHVTVAYQDIPPLDMVLHVIPQPVSVTCTPSVLSPGDTATITIKQLLADGSLIDFSPDQQFEIGLSGGENYGVILLSDEETGGYFSYVSQPFRFIAADSIDGDSVRVRIRAGTQPAILSSTMPGGKGAGGTNVKVAPQKSLTNNTPSKIPMLHEMNSNVKNTPIQYSISKSSTKSVNSGGKRGNIKSVSDANTFWWSNFGIGEVVIKVPKIKVVADKSTLTPLGDNDNKKLDPTCTVPKGQSDTCHRVIDWSKRKTAHVTITVMDANNNPVPDYPFTLSAFVRPNSGGHDHNTNRPTGKFIHNTDTVATFQDKTNSEGKAVYTYICSGFGGVDSIYVKGKADRDTSSTTILLQFSGLEELTEGDHYELYGTKPIHPRNHYGTATLVTKLKALADSVYADSSWVLRYNDMSLVNGGPFDFTESWNTPHQLHRQGVSVDVSDTDAGGHRINAHRLMDIVTKPPFSGGFSYEKALRHFHITLR